MNSLNRVQMADEPPQVNDHIILSEQAGRVSSAGQDLISARRQPASSLNGVLVLTRQIRHLILRGERVWCDKSAGKLCAGDKNIINLFRLMKPPVLLCFIVIVKRRQYPANNYKNLCFSLCKFSCSIINLIVKLFLRCVSRITWIFLQW